MPGTYTILPPVASALYWGDPVTDFASLPGTGTDGEVRLTLDSHDLYVWNGSAWELLAGGGSGDVSGPASSTDNAVTRFNGITGKVIQNSGVIIDDSNNVTGVTDLTVSGGFKDSGFTGSKVLVSSLTEIIESTITTTELGYLDNVTSDIQTQLNNKQPLDATLTALAAYNTNGLLTQTAADTFTGRTITAGSGISVADGNGVAGNPTISCTITQYTDEMAQDAVGSILTDSAEIDFTYDDATPSITADLKITGVGAASYGSATQVGTFSVDSKGRLTTASNTAIAITSSAVTDFNEAAQDAVGGILTDTASIDFTYSDVGNTISATVLPAGVDHNSLANLTVGDVHTQYALLAGRASGQTINGGTGSSENLTLQSTAHATKGRVIIADEVTAQAGVSLSSDLTISLTANQNDWAPTGYLTSSILDITPDATRTITGIANSSFDGRMFILRNMSSSNNFILSHESASSVAANRFSLPYSQDLTIGPYCSAIVVYDSTTSRWQVGSTGTQLLQALTASRAMVTDANGFPSVSATTSTEIGFVSGVTSAIQTQIDGKQASDSDLTALAALATTGVAVRTGAGTWTTRSVAVSGTGISVANGDGVSANPTLSLDADLDAVGALSTTGIATRTASNTWTTRTITAGTNISVSNGNGVSGNPTISTTGIAPLDMQIFTSNGTWTKPTGGQTIARVIVIGGGGGGGSGRRGNTSTNRFGGGGGAGGGYSEAFIPIGGLGATETVVVGTGGAGGIAISANDTNGNNGGGGNNSSFGTAATDVYVVAQGGVFGAGGTATTGTGGDNIAQAAQFIGYDGGNGGTTAPVVGNPIIQVRVGYGPASGGGGGGISSTNVLGTGAAGGYGSDIQSAQPGAGTGASGNAGRPQTTGKAYFGGGGGAGGNSGDNVPSIAGGTGGAGGKYGAGGGGGGASRNGQNSGAGGAGADGIVVVFSW